MELIDAETISQDLANLRKTAGANAKKALAKTWTSPAHREFLALVGDTAKQWYTTWSSVQKTRIQAGGDLDFSEVLYAAENRIATPSETNARLRAKLENGWPENVLKAIVDKTLDAGISVGSVRKAIGGAPRAFHPALASDWGKMGNRVRDKALREHRYAATPKMDGLRCFFFLHMPNEGVYSRSLKPLKNMDRHLAALKEVFTDACIIDGEALAATNSWSETMTGAKKTGAKTPMLFFPFDYIPAQEQLSNKYVMTSEERYERLMLLADSLPEDLFRLVVRSPVLRTVDHVWEEHAICAGEGWEGVVLHDLDAPYSCKRSRSWIKVKAWQSAELMCVGFFQGTGKHLGRLGGIVVEGFGVRSEVGTGFTDAMREHVWENQALYLGRSAEIKYFEVTPDSSLRFPSFLRWRDE